MQSMVRRTPMLLLMAFLVLAAVGCGSDEKPQEQGLTQAEADDLMQALASMAAIDRGGWLTAYESTLNAHPRSNVAWQGAFAPIRVTGGVLPRDSSFTRGPMTWNFSFTYFDTVNAARNTWDPAVRYVDAACRTTGLMTIQSFNGSTGQGQYGYIDTLLCDGYRDTADFLTFRGLSLVDTALITLTSGSTSRYYYFDNLVDLSAVMPKDEASTYPLASEMEILAFVDALNSPSRTDRNKILDVTMIIEFDGTQTPRASITMNTESPTERFNYTVDLRSGQIARAP